MITYPRVLLLGAGFTANFGAPIANQIWKDLFNNEFIQKSPKLKAILKKYRMTNDFESFYEQVISDQVQSVEKEIVINAISNIYKQIDKTTQLTFENSNISLQDLILFLKKFSKNDNGSGFVFTLNQDLFLEWLFNQYKSSEKNLLLEGREIKYFGPIDTPRFAWHWYQYPLKRSFINHVILPTSKELDTWAKNNFIVDNNQSFPFYVKLHGSFGWYKEEKNYTPIIGSNKLKKTNQEPLLKFYKSKFKEILDEKVAIWVIGYSFSDKHINSMLINSMIKHKSSLFIIDVKPLNKLYDHILQYPKLYKALDEHLSGYYQCKLSELFPSNSNVVTYLAEQLSQSLGE